MKKGFTIIELLVVAGIIALMTALILPNYRSGDRQLALQRSAYKMGQDLRRVQEMAMSAEFSEKTGGEVPAGGYGIQFDKTEPGKYILFGDKDNNHDYDGATDYIVEEIQLEKGIVVVELQTDKASRDIMSISFVSPDPQTYITDDLERIWARITLASEEDLTKTKTIFVNNAGLITIE